MNSFFIRTLLLLPLAASLQAQNVAVPVVSPDNLPIGYARPHSQIMNIVNLAAVNHGPGQASCNSSNICYYFPSDINRAYATAAIHNGNGGAGITVGIVDPYYNTQTESDLATFSAQFGLPACSIASGCLTIVSQTGGAPTAGFSQGGAVETNLDVQWVHAIAPNAKILLVTANSLSFANLDVAVLYAQQHSDVVSNSYGAPEFAGETGNDFAYSASTVPILFSSGDSGAQSYYPCSSIYVTCVGGTNLVETATGYRNQESAWAGSGGGCSSQIAAPGYQAGISTAMCPTMRGVPDVAALADPNSGVLVYLGSNTETTPGYYLVGGTSLSCPVFAAIVANIDTARQTSGKSKLGSNLNQLIYGSVSGTSATAYHYRYFDVTTGTSGFAATQGWDKATGLGVPLGPALTNYLISLP